jgi:hypothetical protein
MSNNIHQFLTSEELARINELEFSVLAESISLIKSTLSTDQRDEWKLRLKKTTLAVNQALRDSLPCHKRKFAINDQNELGWIDSVTGEDWEGFKLPEPEFPHHSKARHYFTIATGVQDVKVKSQIVGGGHKKATNTKRGKITGFSKKSCSRLESHVRNLPDNSIVSFLTLTYPKEFPTNGPQVKRHLKNMKEWLKRRGIAGVWFLEFQSRGAPHFHAFMTGYVEPDRVAKAWDKIVSSGDPKHYQWHSGELSGRPCIELFRNAHAASAYATKYATKTYQKDVPEEFQDVGRFWGCWGKLRPVWNYRVFQGDIHKNVLHKIVALVRAVWGGRTDMNREQWSYTLRGWGGGKVR